MLVLKIIKIISVLLFLSPVLAEKEKPNGLNINFHQNDYQLKTERVEIVRYNKNYGDVTAKTFKYNRTCTAFNITADLKVELEYQGDVVIQAYKFASNEYRLFPMRFEVNVCDAYSKDTFGIATFSKCGNSAGCPLKKGKLEICNFTPDPSHFPPLIPNGKYMWELQLLYLSEEAALARFYLEIFRPFVY